MEEVHVEVELRYDRSLIVPLSKLADVLALLCTHQYKVDGYGKDRKLQHIAPSDLPEIRLVPQHMLLSARLAGDAEE